MSLIILPTDQEYIDADGVLRYQLPPDILNPNDLRLDPQVRKKLLHLQHAADYLEDGLQTRNIRQRPDGRYEFHTSLPLASYMGFAFESYTVRALNNNKSFFKNAFQWCSRRDLVKDDYSNQFKAIGTGLLHTFEEHINFLAPQDKQDIKFIRPKFNKKTRKPYFDLLTEMGTNLSAGIQTKAITGNEKQLIVLPIVQGIYSHVLTYLYSSSGRGMHTHDVCMQILREMYDTREIPEWSDYIKFSNAIKSPQMLGLDQMMVDSYYRYMRNNYPSIVDPSELTTLVANMEISLNIAKMRNAPIKSNLILPNELDFEIE